MCVIIHGNVHPSVDGVIPLALVSFLDGLGGLDAELDGVRHRLSAVVLWVLCVHFVVKPHFGIALLDAFHSRIQDFLFYL